MADEQEVIDKPASREIIAPGYTFGTITDQIATVVLTKRTPAFWFGGFAVGLGLLFAFLMNGNTVIVHLKELAERFGVQTRYVG